MKHGVLGKITGVLLIGVMAFGFAGCGQKAEPSQKDATTAGSMAKDISTDNAKDGKKVIIMGTNAEFPPFEFRNDKNEVDGFDAALAKEVAKELGAELKIEDMAFDSLLPALQSGKINFIAAGMTVDPDRQKNVDFSDPYYKATQLIIVKSDNDKIKSQDDLKGKKIGVQEGTTGDISVASKIENAEVSRFKKGIDAAMDLKNGKLDAVIIDANPAKIFAGKNPELKVLDQQLSDEDYAIAVKKGDKELLDTVNKVIKNLKDSGKYDELVKQYIEQ